MNAQFLFFLFFFCQVVRDNIFARVIKVSFIDITFVFIFPAEFSSHVSSINGLLCFRQGEPGEPGLRGEIGLPGLRVSLLILYIALLGAIEGLCEANIFKLHVFGLLAGS